MRRCATSRVIEASFTTNASCVEGSVRTVWPSEPQARRGLGARWPATGGTEEARAALVAAAAARHSVGTRAATTHHVYTNPPTRLHHDHVLQGADGGLDQALASVGAAAGALRCGRERGGGHSGRWKAGHYRVQRG